MIAVAVPRVSKRFLNIKVENALIVRQCDTRRRRKITDRRTPEKKSSFIAVTMSRFQLQ
jgi:hypothetical protein